MSKQTINGDMVSVFTRVPNDFLSTPEIEKECEISRNLQAMILKQEMQDVLKNPQSQFSGNLSIRPKYTDSWVTGQTNSGFDNRLYHKYSILYSHMWIDGWLIRWMVDYRDGCIDGWIDGRI